MVAFASTVIGTLFLLQWYKLMAFFLTTNAMVLALNLRRGDKGPNQSAGRFVESLYVSENYEEMIMTTYPSPSDSKYVYFMKTVDLEFLKKEDGKCAIEIIGQPELKRSQFYLQLDDEYEAEKVFDDFNMLAEGNVVDRAEWMEKRGETQRYRREE